jgi:hypothetical protein
VSGCFYAVAHTSAVSSIGPVADTLYAAPIYIAQRVSAAGVGVRVSTGAAGTAIKMGLYANSAGRPAGLLAAGGSVATTGTGDAFSAFPSNLAVAPGWYWIATILNGAPLVQTIGGTTEHVIGQLTGSTSMQNVTQASATNSASGVIGSGATYAGGLPSSFGASTLATGSAGVPIGCIKIA